MTIAKLLNITEFPYELRENGRLVYFETISGSWSKYKYDLNGNEIYFENSGGFYRKRQYDSNNNLIGEVKAYAKRKNN